MPANTIPIFTLTPVISKANITSAATALDGTTATLIWTAGSNGGFITSMTVKSTTTTATSAAATLRIWVNNGSTSGTAANNFLIKEYTIGAVTAGNTAATLNYEFPINLQLPATYTIYVAIATMAGSTGWDVTGIGANY